MLSQREIKLIEEKSTFAGDLILKMAKNKQSFSSFIKRKDKDDFFLCFEQSFLMIPMNKSHTIFFENNREELNKINDYDLSVILEQKYGKKNCINVKIKNHIIYIIIQSKSQSDLKDMFFYTWPNIMKNNPYLKTFGK